MKRERSRKYRTLERLRMASQAVFFGLFVHPAGLAVCGLTMSIFFPAAIDWLHAEHGENRERVFATAIASVGVALVSMHFFVGVLTDLVGIRNALLFGPFCLVALLVLLFFENEIRKREAVAVDCLSQNERDGRREHGPR